jgi:uncharacterized protein (UPF0335 family)
MSWRHTNYELDQQSHDRVLAIIGAAEALIEEKREIQAQLTDLLKSAKAEGLNVAAIKAAIKLRAMPEEKRLYLDETTQAYLAAAEAPQIATATIPAISRKAAK